MFIEVMELSCRMKSRSHRVALAALSLFALSMIGTSSAEGSNQEALVGLSGRIVDSIVIDNRSIYDTSDPAYKSFIFRWANRLHRKTRKWVVANEVLLRVGSPYSPDLADETARNLRRSLPIYDAWVESDTLADGRLVVTVVTIDQWSLSGGGSAKREANEINYWVGLTERNFLGHNQFVSGTYFIEASEADHVRATFADNRLFGLPVRLELDYSDDPRSKFTELVLSKPYYDLTQKFALGFAITTIGGRRDVYKDENLIAQSEYDGDQLYMSFAFRYGSYLQKGSARLEYKYRSEGTTKRSVYTDDSLDTYLALRSFPADSQYHDFRLTLGVSNLHFIKRRRIDGFGYTEDFTLGSAAEASVSQAFDGDSTVHRSLGLGLAQGSLIRPGLLILSAGARLWYHRDEAIRRRLQFTTHFYNQSVSFLTVAIRAVYTSDWRVAQTNDLVLGGNTGLRGFSRYFRTGDRRAVLNLEGRLFPELEFLSVLFGGALFVDLGRSFKAGEGLSWKGYYAAVGAGLRISFERSSRSSLFRCDVAWSEHAGWQLSVSSGQFFSAARNILALTSH